MHMAYNYPIDSLPRRRQDVASLTRISKTTHKHFKGRRCVLSIKKAAAHSHWKQERRGRQLILNIENVCLASPLRTNASACTICMSSRYFEWLFARYIVRAWLPLRAMGDIYRTSASWWDIFAFGNDDICLRQCLWFYAVFPDIGGASNDKFISASPPILYRQSAVKDGATQWRGQRRIYAGGYIYFLLIICFIWFVWRSSATGLSTQIVLGNNQIKFARAINITYILYGRMIGQFPDTTQYNIYMLLVSLQLCASTWHKSDILQTHAHNCIFTNCAVCTYYTRIWLLNANNIHMYMLPIQHARGNYTSS